MRSGTTLLGKILDAHPTIRLGYYQIDFLRFFGIRFAPINKKENQRKFLKCIEKHLMKYDIISEKKKRSLEEYFKTNSKITFQKLYTILIKTLFDVQNDHIWGEKYAGDGHDAEFFLNLFPKGKVIGIIRDPRATFVSHKYRLPENARELRSFHILRNWKDYVRISNLIKNKFGTNTFLEIRYEDLISAPEEITKRICQFLDIDWDKKMVLIEQFKDEQGKQWQSNTSFESFNGFNKKALTRFKKLISQEDQNFIEQYLHNEIIARDYPFYGNKDKNLLNYQTYLEKLHKASISVGRYKIALLIHTLNDKNSEELVRWVYQNGNELTVFTDDSSKDDNYLYKQINLQDFQFKSDEFDFIHIHGSLNKIDDVITKVKELGYKIFVTNGSEIDPNLINHFDWIIASSESEAMKYQQYLPKIKIKVYDEKNTYEKLQSLYRRFVIHNVMKKTITT